MASLLAFARWRNNESGTNATTNTSNEHGLSQSVSASSSDDSTIHQIHQVSKSSSTGVDTMDSVVRTPDGLRPRKSSAQLRESINKTFPVKKLDWNPEGQVTTTLPSLTHSHPLPVSEPTALPPLLCGSSVISSPQVSNASFYSSRCGFHSEPVAESPNLGRAKTAVGALVGQCGRSYTRRGDIDL